MRKIIAITGARSEYDLLVDVFKELNNSPDFDFSIILTGPHLSEKYGYTANYVVNDGFEIKARIHNLIDSNQKIGRIISVGNQISALSQVLDLERPDIVLVAGDREEAISTTMTCAFLSIAVAHFFGGDIAKDGNIDNSIRYASSKFAHIHFTTLVEHKDNLIRLGEDENRIYVVGNPAIDRLLKVPEISKKTLLKSINKDNESDYCILIQHPIITELDKQREHIRTTLESLLKINGLNCFINYPNSDAGNFDIISEYEYYANQYPSKFTIFKNLERNIYINLLRHADFLIGNSSSGIIEVASLGLGAINIGERQKGRISNSNVIFVDNKENEIIEAIQFVRTNENFRKELSLKTNKYGDGNSTSKIVDILRNLKINDELLYKNITY
jgi:GDP/UDP-N,N'-diacetylbacillosamine 2-epimerase (hydrolysing)